MDLVDPNNDLSSTEADAKLTAIVQDALVKEFTKAGLIK